MAAFSIWKDEGVDSGPFFMIFPSGLQMELHVEKRELGGMGCPSLEKRLARPRMPEKWNSGSVGDIFRHVKYAPAVLPDGIRGASKA